MVQNGKLEDAKQIYIAAAEALNKVLQQTKDDVNFQTALKEKLNQILDKAQKINFLNAPTVIKKNEEQKQNLSGPGSQV